MKTKINVTADYNNDYTTYTKTLVRDFEEVSNTNITNQNGGTYPVNEYPNNSKSLNNVINKAHNTVVFNSRQCTKTKLQKDNSKSNKHNKYFKKTIHSILGNVLLIDGSLISITFATLLVLKGTPIYDPNEIWGICIFLCAIFNLMIIGEYVDK